MAAQLKSSTAAHSPLQQVRRHLVQRFYGWSKNYYFTPTSYVFKICFSIISDKLHSRSFFIHVRFSCYARAHMCQRDYHQSHRFFLPYCFCAFGVWHVFTKNSILLGCRSSCFLTFKPCNKGPSFRPSRTIK